eukprot:5050750-Amphidinium_carterae.1
MAKPQDTWNTSNMSTCGVLQFCRLATVKSASVSITGRIQCTQTQPINTTCTSVQETHLQNSRALGGSNSPQLNQIQIDAPYHHANAVNLHFADEQQCPSRSRYAETKLIEGNPGIHTREEYPHLLQAAHQRLNLQWHSWRFIHNGTVHIMTSNILLPHQAFYSDLPSGTATRMM